MNILDLMRTGQKSSIAQVQCDLRLLEQRVQTALASVQASPPSNEIFRVSSLQAKIEEARARQAQQPHGHHEIARIVRLPIIHPLTPEEVDAYSRENVLTEAYNRGFRLKQAQAEAFMAYESYGGCFAPIGAGAGKTLVDVGIASRAYSKGLAKGLLVIPSAVYHQFVVRSLPWIRNQIPVNVPFICLGNTTAQKRIGFARSNRAGCYVLPWSCLSTKDASEVLAHIRPDYIILDEAHRGSDRRAARTKRLMAYIKFRADAKHGQPFAVEVVPLSGTITNKAIREYHHLITWALRENSPLPLSGQMALEWGQYIDSKAEYTGSHAGPIGEIVDWARMAFPKERIDDDIPGFRTSFRLRLVTAPGVVATADSEVATSLYIHNKPVPADDSTPGWKRLQELIRDVVDKGITPSGDTIEHAIHSFRWLYELSAGFYNELVWPSAQEYAKRKGLSTEKEAAEILQRARDHHDLAQIFAKLLRKWLSAHNQAGRDTPLLVRSDMAQHGAKHVGAELYAAWQDMRAAEFEGMPERDSRAVRVCDYKVRAAVEWASGLKSGGIIWAWNQELVSWIHEMLPGSTKADAGEASNRAITDVKHADKIFVASIAAHGEGKELQHFQEQYFAQWPRGARVAEQALARLHRLGQTADELTVNVNNTTLFDQMNFAACLVDALYIQQTTGNRQRVIYAGYDPLPVIFPPSVLRERGMNNKMLSTEHQRILDDLFGDT